MLCQVFYFYCYKEGSQESTFTWQNDSILSVLPIGYVRSPAVCHNVFEGNYTLVCI
jgi:hypothetical protein